MCEQYSNIAIAMVEKKIIKTPRVSRNFYSYNYFIDNSSIGVYRGYACV